MDDIKDIRDEFYRMAVQIYGISRAQGLMKDFDKIIPEGAPYFAVEGFEGLGYSIEEDEFWGEWFWLFTIPGEGVEVSERFHSRRDAMLDAARDADETLFIDEGMGKRIRDAI